MCSCGFSINNGTLQRYEKAKKWLKTKYSVYLISWGQVCFYQNLLTDTHTSYLSFLLHRQDFLKPNFTPKKTTKDTKTLKMTLKKSNVCSFFTQSGKNYTSQKIFTQVPPVVPVTNMRYGMTRFQYSEKYHSGRVIKNLTLHGMSKIDFQPEFWNSQMLSFLKM